MSKLSFFLIFLFSVIFTVYAVGVSPSVFGGDSGDVILAAWFGGVAHPPGYPINSITGWIFTHLPYAASVAYKANLMAAFLQSLTVIVVFLICKRLTGNLLASVTSSLIIAFNPLFWLYAHILEVFQWNVFLVAVSVYFLFDWGESKRKVKTKLLLSIFFLGLAVFHHQTSVFLGPAYLYYISRYEKNLFSKPKEIFKLAGVFFLGILPYIFVPFAAAAKTPINWDHASNMHNFIRLITRADYGTFTSTTFLIGTGLQNRFLQSGFYFVFAKADFGYVGIFLILLGLGLLFLKKKHVFFFVILAVFFTGPFFLFYAIFPPTNDFFLGLIERFLLVSYIFFAIPIAISISFIFERINEFIFKNWKRSLASKKMLVMFFCIAFLIYPLYLFRQNFYKTDLSNFMSGDYLAEDLLSSVEPNSIVFVSGDTVVFNTQYVHYTKSTKDNVAVILGSLLFQEGYRKQVLAESPFLKAPENYSDKGLSNDSSSYMFSIIDENKDNFNIYSSEYAPELEGYKWQPWGLLKKLVKADSYNPDLVNTYNWEKFKNFKFLNSKTDANYTQFMDSHIADIYYFFLVKVADELIANEQNQEAINFNLRAIDLNPNLDGAYFSIAQAYYGLKDCDKSKAAFEKSDPQQSNWRAMVGLAFVYKNCYNDSDRAQGYFDAAEKLKNKDFSAPLEKF